MNEESRKDVYITENHLYDSVYLNALQFKLLIWVETDALKAAVSEALSQSKKNALNQIHWHSVTF